MEVEGDRSNVRQFTLRLETEKPTCAAITSVESSLLDTVGYGGFEIRYSEGGGDKSVLISPDIATCADCLRELFDARDRRHRYPFTNCTNCGPRFTIIESLPYDRPHTTMKRFTMCPECEREYRDPLDRRFHAQPNACPRCGPQLALWGAAGNVLTTKDNALFAAAGRVRAGEVLALKGLGGFQLMVDARDEAAVARLRQRKHREDKPLALMYPSFDAVREDCQISDLEEALLLSAEAPIVILARKPGTSRLAPSVAPRNPSLGAMLPCTPLQHLLLRELGFPVVATSGNLSDEPICIDEHEAVDRLRGIADCFLVHDLPLVRHMDDSVVRVMCGRELILRRARGYAPLPIPVAEPLPTLLAVGGHLKNTVALSVGTDIFLSQHIGDLETKEAHSAFRKAATDLPRLYDAKIERVVCDLHPDYLSTKYAAQMPVPAQAVQHHWAHIASCMADNGIEPPALGVAWDGTGYGNDGTVWGGEFLLATGASFERVAHLRQFRLPGGDAAIKQPRRAALGVLHDVFGDEVWTRPEMLRGFSKIEITTLRQMLEKRVNAPLTSSAGRLFDAVAALVGLRDRASFEGQAAMELEFAIESGIEAAYSFDLREGGVIHWQATILEIVRDLHSHESTGAIAAKFHNMLAAAIVAVARKIGEPRVVLSGGCFQNKYFTERTVRQLRDAGFQPHWHRRIPPNDGGLALGQIIAAAWAAPKIHGEEN